MVVFIGCSCLNNIVKDDDMGGACSMHRREETFVQLWLGNQKIGRQKIGRHGRRWEGNIEMNLKEVEWIWTRLIWIIGRTNGSSCEQAITLRVP
jgi:hypothetical protein